VLVITVWASTEAGGELRLRVVSNTDVISGVEHRFNSTEPEEVLGQVRAWLADFAAAHQPGRAGQTPGTHHSADPKAPGDAGVTRARQGPVSLIRDDPGDRERRGRKGAK
jgi:hypothetical protein